MARGRKIKQYHLEEIVELTELLWGWRTQPEEMAAEVISQYELELRVSLRKLRRMLAAGAVVECGEYTLKDALPTVRQMDLPFQPELASAAAS